MSVWDQLQQMFADPKAQAYMGGMGQQLLAASGPSKTPINFNQALAAGMQGGQERVAEHRARGREDEQDAWARIKQQLALSEHLQSQRQQAMQEEALRKFQAGDRSPEVLSVLFPEKFGGAVIDQQFPKEQKYQQGINPQTGQPGFFSVQDGKPSWLPGVTATSKGMAMTFDPESGQFQMTQGGAEPIALTSSMKGKVQGDISTMLDQLQSLDTIGANYARDYLTYQGRLQAMVGSAQDKVGMDTELSRFNAQRSEGLRLVEQFFNAYRKDITGAAAAERELEDLKKATLHGGLGPQAFVARYNGIVQSIRNGLKNKTDLLDGPGGVSGAVQRKLNLYPPRDLNAQP